MDDKLSEAIEKIINSISDRNSCLTKLAESRLSLMNGLSNMSINNGDDVNGNKEKWEIMKDQCEKIDSLIIKIASIKDNG